jgi:thymidylate kinase
VKKGLFVLVEGFDGVGKTTLSNRVARNLGYEYHKSPEGVFSEVRSAFDTEKTNFVDRLSFYSSVAIRNSITAEQLTENGVNVIMDRYYHSIIAYHYKEYNSLSDSLKNIYKLLSQPDLVFCLELDYFIIKERQALSGLPIKLDDQIFVRKELHQNITEIYRNVLPKDTIFIDNSGTIEETEVQILDEINKHNEKIQLTSFPGS